MRLSDVTDIRMGNPSADFWLIRKGSPNTVGKPTREFSPEAIGITVTATDRLDPAYLYHMMDYVQMRGYWEAIAKGTTRLVNIRTQDVKNLPLS